MFAMKDLGHALPGRQIKHLQVTVDVITVKSYTNHNVKQLSNWVAYTNLYTKGPFSKLWFESEDTKLIHSS